MTSTLYSVTYAQNQVWWAELLFCYAFIWTAACKQIIYIENHLRRRKSILCQFFSEYDVWAMNTNKQPMSCEAQLAAQLYKHFYDL